MRIVPLTLCTLCSSLCEPASPTAGPPGALWCCSHSSRPWCRNRSRCARVQSLGSATCKQWCKVVGTKATLGAGGGCVAESATTTSNTFFLCTKPDCGTSRDNPWEGRRDISTTILSACNARVQAKIELAASHLIFRLCGCTTVEPVLVSLLCIVLNTTQHPRLLVLAGLGRGA